MKKINNSDFVIVSLHNNGCGFIRMENDQYECSRANAESMILAARMNGYQDKGYIRHENGDVTYIFN